MGCYWVDIWVGDYEGCWGGRMFGLGDLLVVSKVLIVFR